jgi:signal transduction histidine kinase
MSELIQNRLEANGDTNLLEPANSLTESLRQMTAYIATLEKHSSPNQFVEKLEDVDLNELFNEVKSTLASMISVANGSVTWETMPIVRGDKDRLLHLFVNIIENAFKYGNKELTKVHITSPSIDVGIEIRISDNGPEIQGHEMEQVFDDGYRDQPQRSTVENGKGLAFCYRSMNVVGGSIRVDPSAVVSTCFVLRFPPVTKPEADNFPA